MIETKIQILRLTLGYTQKYMADQLGIRQESYSRIESGQQKIKPSEPLLPCIAKLLGVPIADLLNNQPIVVCTGDLIGAQQKQGMKDVEIAELKYQLAKKESQIEKLLEMLLVGGGGVNEYGL
jgi:transcriptional regulator with XRE-family HTH domain